jgi:hypothetical protein
MTFVAFALLGSRRASRSIEVRLAARHHGIPDHG